MFDDLYIQMALVLLLLPLGLIGIWRWSVFLIKKKLARRYRPIPANTAYAPSDVTLVVPVYNENPAHFAHAIKSWIAEKPAAVILVIDHTDHACIGVARTLAASSEVVIEPIVTTRSGKREALVDGIRRVNTEFVAVVDSDTFFETGALQLLLAPFTDHTIGGTAPRQKVWQPQSVAERVYSIQLDERYDMDMPFLDAGGLTTTCISGRTGVYRRSAVADKLNELEFEYFMGSRCISGDDKCLTRIIQREGWKVKYQDTAIVWTHAAPDVMTYLKQRIRWTRNTWRSDIKALTDDRAWIWQNKHLAFHTIDRFIQPFTLILGPIFFFTALFAGFTVAALLFLSWVFVTRYLKVLSHISRSPRSILVLPYYILFSYIIAVLKIYALFTVWKQGWKTRWSTGRESASRFRDSIVEVGLPLLATVFVVVLMGTALSALYGYTVTIAMANDSFKSRTVSLATMQEEAAELEESIRNPTAYTRHELEAGETPSRIATRLNVPRNSLRVLQSEDAVLIPIVELRTPNTIAALAARPLPSVRYEPARQANASVYERDIVSENVVYLEGSGSAVSIGELLTTLTAAYGDAVATEQEPGVWLLKASISVGRDVTLYFDGTDVRWLKLYSANDYFTWIASFDGSMHIENVKISSWDPASESYDVTTTDGRSFILARNSGRMDIMNAELAYLGYTSYGEYGRGYPFGGVYGVSWKIEGGTFNKKIMAGNVTDSRIHHNQFGIYTFGTTGQVMRGNHVYNQIDYGFDPHDDSNHMIIEHNYAYDNGNHGIITSKRCFKNIIAHNTSSNNRLHGIMLDQDSNESIIRENQLYGNTDGFVAYDSHGNYVFENDIHTNAKSGVRLNVMSSKNFVFQNTITDNAKGAYLYDHVIDNHFVDNTFASNNLAAHFRNATYNVFSDNVNKENGGAVQVSSGSLKNYVSFITE